jgi:A/G-specific adenine glycosylase
LSGGPGSGAEPQRSDLLRPELLRPRLLAWYEGAARTLPWRTSPTPYHVLLSELMLQQTRVETVIPYFHRFVERWPTLEALAAAEEQEVLAAWAGLGYYRRARSLLAAARAAVARGGLPADVAGLLELPGIGPYTAGAIASIAFGLPAAAVDGNVERVLSRVDGIETNPRSPQGARALRARAEAISAVGVAAEVTQALMELGATVCTPRRPRCAQCPWQEPCVARRGGRAEELPRLPARTKPLPVQGVAGLLWRADGVWMGRRPPGLLGGLWEPVMAEVDGSLAPAVAVRQAYARRAGLEVQVVRPLGQVVHVFTHRRLVLEVFELVELGPSPSGPDGSYEALVSWDGNRQTLALSKLAEKVLALGQPPALWLAADPGAIW